MKYLITTIAALVLVGCGESRQAANAPEAQTAKAPDISIHEAVKEGNVEAVKQHIAAGTDVNTRGAGLNTPLLKAAQLGKAEIVELLIAEGADVRSKNKYNSTALNYAVIFIKNNKDIVELLIAKGVDVNAKGVYGTPLDMADGETADLLRKHGGKTTKELKAEGK